jgi:cysteine-rich repeat protein
MRRRLKLALWPLTVFGCVMTALVIVRPQTPTPVCANRIIEAPETCDDGNTLNGDGCNSVCVVEQQCLDEGNKFSFFLWSDSYTSAGDTGVFRLMQDAVDRVKYAARIIPRFWIATGDIPFMSVSHEYLDEINDAISDSPSGPNYPFACQASNGKFPYFVAVGNHDVDGYDTLTPQLQYDYWANHVGPKLDTTLVGLENFRVGPSNGDDAKTTYSFDYKNAHFIVVNQYFGDPNYPTPNPVACIRPELYTWIDQDLAQTTQPVKFVAGHEPAWPYCSSEPGYGGDFCPGTEVDNLTPAFRPRPYSSAGSWLQPFGEHWGDSLEDSQCPAGSREAFWNMLAGHNVVAHFAGHTHAYSSRLVQSDGVRRNDVSPYSKTGETFSPAEGIWEVNTGQAHNSAGTAYVLVTVQDSLVTFEAYDQMTFNLPEPFQLIESWSVSVDGNYNHPPVLAPVLNQTVVASQTLAFTASATDPEGQGLTFSLVGAPPGAAIDPGDGSFIWTPTVAQLGTYNFSIKVTDAGSPPASGMQPVQVAVIAPPPDLIENMVSTSATAVLPGATINVSDTVANQGTKSTGFVVAFHLSIDGSYGGPDDVAMTATRSVSTLAASASSTGSINLKIPATIPLGDYHVCAFADSLNKVVEGSETNNALCTSSSISVTRPDLVFMSIAPGASTVRVGATLSVTDSVQNIAPIVSPSFKVGYRLSVNQISGDADDVVVGTTRSVASLAAGAVSQATVKPKIPKVAPGSYYVCANADSGGTVVEISEANNAGCSATPVQITN